MMLIPFLFLFDTLAIRGGTVHSMEAGAKPVVATILVENGRIEAVGPDVAVPEGAKVLDAAGLHVLPGLIDGFTNFDPDHDLLYVSAGVTCVRDVGNDLVRILAECERDARERSPGPAIWCAGAILDGSPPSTKAAVRLDTAADVEAKMPRYFEFDPIDYLSFHSGLGREPWKAVIEMAHKRHRQVWGPLPRGASLDDVLAAGQDGLFHLEAFLPAGSRWDTATKEGIEAAVDKAGAVNLRVTPTLAFYGKQLVAPDTQSPVLALLSPFYEASWRVDGEARARRVTPEYLKRGVAALELQTEIVRRLHASGARLVPGSATPNPWLVPGEALLDELSMWRRAGLSASECVRLATAGAAEALGMEKRGTIVRGKIADFVLTKDDPEADLAHLHDPAIVVLRGRVLDRADLVARLANLRVVQGRVRETLQKPLHVAAPEVPPGDVILTGFVETRGLGTRISAERYAVVRGYDGSLTYCGRSYSPGEATTVGTETSIQQTIQGGELVALDVKIVSNARTVDVRGERAAGKLSITRRVNGQFVDTNHLDEKPVLVDCGSVTTLLILGYHRRPGVFNAIFFDDYDPALGKYELRLDRDATHLVRTPTGDMSVAFDAFGAPIESKRESGNGILHTKSLESRAVDKKGLPMPEEKRAAAAAVGKGPEDAKTPREAAGGGVPPK